MNLSPLFSGDPYITTGETPTAYTRTVSPPLCDPYLALDDAPSDAHYTRQKPPASAPPLPPPTSYATGQAPNYIVLRDESAMSVMPATEEAKDFLMLRFREMVKQGRFTKMLHREEPLYRVIESNGQEALQTYQGLWEDFKKHMEDKGRRVQVLDLRGPFRAPNIEAAVIGLRPPQEALMRTALATLESGLVGAPTRFGKTFCILACCKAYNGLKIVVTAPGIDLCRQLEDDLRRLLPGRDVRGLYTGSKHRSQGLDITVCSVDSLDKCDPGSTDLLLIDEPHAMVADGRLPRIHKFYRARKIGFGATLNGRFDKKDRLITALIGPIIANKTYLEAVAEGSIAPCKMVFIKVPFSKDAVPGNMQRDKTWRVLLTQSARVAKLIKKVCDECVPRAWQTMIFIKDEKQADYLFAEAMDPTCSIAMAKKLKPKERKVMTELIATNKISRVIASNIYVQGVTFPDLRVVINAAGGGASTGAIQKPGRLLQAVTGKNYGVMVDLLYECTDAAEDDRNNPPYGALVGECWARHKAYTNIGYDVVICESSEQLKKIIAGAYQ